MIRNLAFENILFLDIETVSAFANYQDLPEAVKPLWRQKGERFARQAEKEWDDDVAEQVYSERAAIFAEFGKIIVISVGFVFQTNDGPAVKLKSFTSPDEKTLLTEFAGLLTAHYNNPARHMLCGHNIKEFDIPYICRRMIIHGLELPDIINVTGKKPWETAHLLDTMNLWKFGDFKHFTSLNLLAHVLGIPTPKDDIDGSMVGSVYWDDNDIDRIATYCEKDVVTVIQLLRRFQGMPLIDEEQLQSVSTFAS